MARSGQQRNGSGTAAAATGNDRSGLYSSFSYSASKTLDPTALLARGYTARFLNTKLAPAVTPLQPDDIDRDLRHVNAYHQAVVQYHQCTYATTNRLPVQHAAAHPSAGDAQEAHSTAHVAVTPAVLPVRIDPDEEKRLAAQRKRIWTAEAIREELEQQYVSAVAHYVWTTQHVLQKAAQQRKDRYAFLKNTLEQVAGSVGVQRARLQMTRELRDALLHRAALLAEAKGNEANVPPDADSKKTAAKDSPLMAAWLEAEELSRTVHSKSSAAGSSTNPIQPWPCTMEPSTPAGIPLLLSAMSTVPEKSLAMKTGKLFGARENSLTWFESHLPVSDDEEEEDDVDVATRKTVDALRKKVDFLESELAKEREANQRLLTATGKARTAHDEWVAMIALVRQETESILHRHNVLLESDEAVQAAEEQAAKAPAAEEEEEETVPTEKGEESQGARDAEMPARNAATVLRRSVAADEEAHDGDDEAGEGDEDEDVGGSWEAAGTKRGVEEASETSSSPSQQRTKRRKL
jgi:hypothetical protein